MQTAVAVSWMTSEAPTSSKKKSMEKQSSSVSSAGVQKRTPKKRRERDDDNSLTYECQHLVCNFAYWKGLRAHFRNAHERNRHECRSLHSLCPPECVKCQKNAVKAAEKAAEKGSASAAGTVYVSAHQNHIHNQAAYDESVDGILHGLDAPAMPAVAARTVTRTALPSATRALPSSSMPSPALPSSSSMPSPALPLARQEQQQQELHPRVVAREQFNVSRDFVVGSTRNAQLEFDLEKMNDFVRTNSNRSSKVLVTINLASVFA